MCSLAIFIPYHSHGWKHAGGTNQLSKQQNILHVQSALSRAGLRLELWTAVSPVWQVAVQNDSSKVSGCSPNRSLGNKSFSRTYWQHQNLYLIDAVRQFGYPSFFITISPYEWTLPFPSLLEDLHHQYGKDVTDLPILETILIAHVLEQIARGYLTRGNCNRWNTHVFANATHPNTGNLKTYFPPRLGRPATPSMASQPQHLLDQTKGIRSRQIPCWRQVRVSIQSHVLLPASHNEPSSSFSFWIETSWRREHATHHKVLCTSHCPPDTWRTGDTITDQFEHEGHKEFFINTIVAYVMSLHDILYLWRIRMVNGEVGDLSSISMVNLYPLSPLQRAILNNITTALTSRQQTQAQSSEEDTLETCNWCKCLGKSGTCKSQVLIHAIHSAIKKEMVRSISCSSGPAGSRVP